MCQHDKHTILDNFLFNEAEKHLLQK